MIVVNLPELLIQKVFDSFFFINNSLISLLMSSCLNNEFNDTNTLLLFKGGCLIPILIFWQVFLLNDFAKHDVNLV